MTLQTEESVELEGEFAKLISAALDEDLLDGEMTTDVTTDSIVPLDQWGSAGLYAKQSGVICGLQVLVATFRLLDDRVDVRLAVADGAEVEPGQLLANLEGPVAPILVGERSALNLIGHLSGIASAVRRFTLAAPGVALVDTRKTLPGLRKVQKYAVRVGGGSNHRFALWDGVLIKDTHIIAAGGVGEAVRRVRAKTALPVQAECTSLEEVDQALDAGAAAILLDNQGPDELRRLTEHIKARNDIVMVEASGGVTIDNVAEVARTGVDRISIGAFTHSVIALDISLRLERVWPGSTEGED